jgi:hypothetical protein
LGPVIRGVVGDTLKVTFKNKLKEHHTSMHPHGVWYEKDSEGSPYADGLPRKHRQRLTRALTVPWSCQLPTVLSTAYECFAFGRGVWGGPCLQPTHLDLLLLPVVFQCLLVTRWLPARL